MDIGSAVGRGKGLRQDELDRIADYATDASFDDLERDCLLYADQVTATPVSVDEELFARLAKRFSREQLVELTATITWENHRARFNHAFGVPSEDYASSPRFLGHPALSSRA